MEPITPQPPSTTKAAGTSSSYGGRARSLFEESNQKFDDIRKLLERLKAQRLRGSLAGDEDEDGELNATSGMGAVSEDLLIEQMLARCDEGERAIQKAEQSNKALERELKSIKDGGESFAKKQHDLEVAASQTFGTALSAAQYFLLESLLARCGAERLTLLLQNPRTQMLQVVANVGQGVPKPKRSAPPPPNSGVLGAVMSTGVAANLPRVNLDDLTMCPGPTKPKSALIFPIRRLDDSDKRLGVIMLLNKKRGDAFTRDDELIVQGLMPTLAYLTQTYPLDYSAHCFDPAPLHRVLPHDPITSAASLLPALWEAPNTQLVYHREGPEKFIRAKHMKKEAEDLPPEGVSDHLRSVDEYIATIENCWRESVVRLMEADRMLKQKSSQITDAQEILHRKQRKLDLLKDVLCEHLQRDKGATAPPSPRNVKYKQ